MRKETKTIVQDFVDGWHQIITDYDNETIDQFDDSKFRKEVRVLGNLMNDIGGMSLMLDAHSFFPRDMQRLVEMAWSGIGSWRG